MIQSDNTRVVVLNELIACMKCMRIHNDTECPGIEKDDKYFIYVDKDFTNTE